MVNKYKISLFALFIIVFFGRGEALAQRRISVSQITVYDQNIFRNYFAAYDWVNQTTLNLQHNIQLSKLSVRFDYKGDLNLFYYYADRLSHAHQVGLESAFNIVENFRCNLGSAFQLRKYKPDFKFFDYQTLAAYVQFLWDAWQITPIQFGYRFRFRDFPNLSELSYQEHYVLFQLKHFFPTRTTFIGEFNLGQKNYTSLQIPEEEIVVTPKNSGNGRGQQYGKRHGMMASDTSVVAYNMTAQKAQQISLSLKFAQSIFSKMGVSIEYIKQFSPSNSIRYLTGMEYSYSKDDELYDDPYACEKDELEITVTQILPWQSSLKLYLNLVDKKYLYSIVSDSTMSQTQPDEKRNDQQQLVGLIVEKKFKLNKALKNLSFYAAANYLANQSNDLYFDFDGFYVYSGFELAF